MIAFTWNSELHEYLSFILPFLNIYLCSLHWAPVFGCRPSLYIKYIYTHTLYIRIYIIYIYIYVYLYIYPYTYIFTYTHIQVFHRCPNIQWDFVLSLHLKVCSTKKISKSVLHITYNSYNFSKLWFFKL